METVFDFHPTDAELTDLFGSVEEALEDRELWGADTNYAFIAKLFSLRGHDAEADAYVEKIEDPEYRLSLTLLLHEFVQ